MRGSLLRLPDGQVVVPTHPTGLAGAWSCVVVRDPHDSYPPAGFSIEVPADTLERAQLVDVPDGPPVEREETEAVALWMTQREAEEEDVAVEVDDGPRTEIMASSALTPLDEARLRAARDTGAAAALRIAARRIEELGSPTEGLVSRGVVAHWLERLAEQVDNGESIEP